MYQYPGVYIQEIPSGVRPIAGVSTSDTAFVDYFPRGPMNTATRVANFGDFQRIFGGIAATSEASYAIRQFFVNGGAVAWVVRVGVGTVVAANVSLTDGTDPALAVTAINPGSWGDNLHVAVVHDGAVDGTTFDFIVREYNGDDVVAEEIYRNLSTDAANRRYADSVVARESALVSVAIQGGLRPESSAATSIDAVDQDQMTQLGQGDDGALPGSTQWGTGAAAALTGSEAQQTGIYALKAIAPHVFNLLCIPAAAELPAEGASSVYSQALQLCLDERAFLLVDVPAASNQADTVGPWIEGLSGIRNRNAAVFFPRLRMPDPVGGTGLREVAASGTVAGIFARTDSQRGVWKAPAGTEAKIRNAALTRQLTDAQNGPLNIQGINVARIFPIHGGVLWGARTLDGADAAASEWKYIPVRRTALYIEESLFQGLKWVVFEPNDEPLWAQIRLNVGAFMQTLFRQGAFQGASASEAYFVKCDSETTTQADINLGIVNILVGFAPLKPAEFVVISIQQKAGEAAA